MGLSAATGSRRTGKIRKETKEEKTNKQKNKKIVDTVFISLTTLLIKTQYTITTKTLHCA